MKPLLWFQTHAWEVLVYLLVQVGKGSVKSETLEKGVLSKRIVIIRLAHKPPASPNQMISTLPLRRFFLKRMLSLFKVPVYHISPFTFGEVGWG